MAAERSPLVVPWLLQVLPSAAQRTLEAARRRSRVVQESSTERERAREGGASSSGDENTISFSGELGMVRSLKPIFPKNECWLFRPH